MNILSVCNRKAFTFIEVVTVMGVIAILFSLSAPQLFRLRDRNTLQLETTKIISLIRQQQQNAMTIGKTHGIYFKQSQYVLFSGDIYVSTDEANTTVSFEYPIELSEILFPHSEIRFASRSGEVVDFNAQYHSITLIDAVNNQAKSIIFNSYGIPTSTN